MSDDSLTRRPGNQDKQPGNLATQDHGTLVKHLYAVQHYTELELMFMKHYAPNRCLYIKVAKLRTGVGSAEMSHLQIFFFFFLGGGGGGGAGSGWGGVRVDGVFVKIKEKKKFFFGGGGWSGWM